MDGDVLAKEFQIDRFKALCHFPVHWKRCDQIRIAADLATWQG